MSLPKLLAAALMAASASWLWLRSLRHAAHLRRLDAVTAAWVVASPAVRVQLLARDRMTDAQYAALVEKWRGEMKDAA